MTGSILAIALAAGLGGQAPSGSGQEVLQALRAHWSAPRDAAAAANLARVRTEAGVAAPEPATLEAASSLLSQAEWTWVSMGAFWIAAGLLAAGLWSRRRPLCGIAGAAAVLGLAALVADAALSRRLDREVVVAKAGAPLRISPFATAQSEATLAPGEEVTPLEHHRGWLQVRDGQGRTGWIDSAAVESLVPPHA
jgi:hypothetical protein